MRYYSAENLFGNETCIGFSNTWYVLVFDTKAERDAHVANSTSMATMAIKRKEVSQYHGEEPVPFSGQWLGIDGDGRGIAGCLGMIMACDPHDHGYYQPLYGYNR